MNKTIPFILALILFSIPCLSFADSYEDTFARYQNEFDKEPGSQDFMVYFKEFMQEAGKGDSRAQCRLGDMYYSGIGVKKDYAQAVKWFQKAAEQGLAEAQCSLGLCYQNGDGVEKNLQTAIMWHEKSAQQGNVYSLIYLGNIYWGTDSIKDYSKAEKYLLQAEKQGSKRAAFWLGKLCEDQQDYVSAINWYKKAEDNYELKRLAILSKKALSDLKLFGVKLATATRTEMRAALTNKGMPPIRVEDGYWADIYDSSSTLSGTTRLSIIYTLDSRFAYAVYDYPINMNKQKVVDIMTMVSNKYGLPSGSNDLPDTGEIRAFWRIQHGEISLKRDWPTPSIALKFSVPNNEQQFKKEYAKQEQRNKNKEVQSQTDAF